MIALAHCPTCDLWLSPWQSCLHIEPRANLCDPTPAGRGTLGGGLPPSAPAHLLHDAPHGLANRDRFAGSDLPFHASGVANG